VPTDGRCRSCGGTQFTRRADDNAESMKTRLFAYYKETSTLVGYYWVKRLLRTVDGFRGIDEVAQDISRLLDAQALQRA
jgi:adenylate kinase